MGVPLPPLQHRAGQQAPQGLAVGRLAHRLVKRAHASVEDLAELTHALADHEIPHPHFPKRAVERAHKCVEQVLGGLGRGLAAPPEPQDQQGDMQGQQLEAPLARIGDSE